MLNLDAEVKASVLVEALPYIQDYYGQTVVVKYGGKDRKSTRLNSSHIH